MFANWPGSSGKLIIDLPTNVSTGCLHLFAVPKVDGCTGQGLTAAAMAIWQASLSSGSSTMGPLVSFIVDAASLLENFKPQQNMPCTEGEPNYLVAGSPEIVEFGVRESPNVLGRSTTTLFWKVKNAASVTFAPRIVTGTETAHQLPVITQNLTVPEGELRVTINGTSNWWGEYVLTAHSGHGCPSVERGVYLYCGWRNFKVGTSRVPLLFSLPNNPAVETQNGLPMLGFSHEKQRAKGILDPIFARGFVVEDSTGGRCAIVVADLWSCSQIVKTTVAARIAAIPELAGYTAANLMLCGTHTHSAPGGYFHNYLYNLTGGGFYPAVFEVVVSAYVQAIREANSNAKPGRLYSGIGTVRESGANRSLEAFVLNEEVMSNPAPPDTDDSITVLKFVHDDGSPWRDARGQYIYGANNNLSQVPRRDVGVLTWHAMHPTNLGMYNEAISGDNKGWAALQFESAINGFSRTDFVAAFANSNCGDVTGNVQRDGNGIIVRTEGKVEFEWPRGGPTNLTTLQKNITAMRNNGNSQFYAAKAVFDDSNVLKEIDGSVDSRYTHVDMSNVTLKSGLFAGSRTWPAVMGVSFGAGSTEDGEAIAYILSHPISSGIIEGITNPSYDAVGPAAIFRLSTAIAGVVGPAAVLGILTGGIGLIPALVGVAAGGALGVAIAKAILDAANPLEQAYISAVGGYLGLVVSRLFVHNIPRFSDGTTFNIVLPSTIDTPQSVIDGHFPKPIMFAAGLAKTDEFSGPVVPCPMVPNVVPVQLLRIGKLALAGIPGEITTMGGIRLRNSILASMTGSSRVDTVALCTYCNSYSGYISTFEEYQSQQYEGASTLYGPHTLEAYQQIFSGMATAMSSSLGLDAVGLVDPGPESLPGIYVAP